MIEPRKYTKEEISTIIEALRIKFPDVTISLYSADPRFIRFCEDLGTQQVVGAWVSDLKDGKTLSKKEVREVKDKAPTVPIHRIEYIHLSEVEQILKS